MLAESLAVSTVMIVVMVIFHFVGLRAIIGLVTRVLGVHLRHGHIVGRTVGLLAIMLALVALHAIEIWTYAFVYLAVGAVKDLEEAVYYSTSAFGTLGGENIIIESQWRLAGAIEGFFGFLLIGLSTAFLVIVIDRLGLLDSLAHAGEKPEAPARDNVQP